MRTPIPVRRNRPAGNRELQEAFQESEKAVRFRYYGWLLWIPRSALTKVGDQYSAPEWAITSAKDHPSAERYGSDEDAMERVFEILGTQTVHTGPVVTSA